MSLLEDKANAICEKLEQNKDFRVQFGEDPVPSPTPRPFLDFIMELLKQFMPMILGCFATPARARAGMQNPSRGMKLLAGMQIRRALRSNSDDDDWAVPEIRNAMFSVAKDTTEPEFAQLFA